MPVLREGSDRQEYGEAPPTVLQSVVTQGGGGGVPTAVSGERPEEGFTLLMLP